MLQDEYRDRNLEMQSIDIPDPVESTRDHGTDPVHNHKYKKMDMY